MRLLVLLTTMALAIFLQATLLNFFPVFGIKPDLLLMLVVFNSFLRGHVEGALSGFLGGIILDFTTGSYIGMNALALMATGYLVGLTESKLYKDSSIIIIFMVWASSFLEQTLIYILLNFVGVHINPVVAILRIILPTATYTAVLVPLFYNWFYKSNRSGLLRDKSI